MYWVFEGLLRATHSFSRPCGIRRSSSCPVPVAIKSSSTVRLFWVKISPKKVWPLRKKKPSANRDQTGPRFTSDKVHLFLGQSPQQIAWKRMFNCWKASHLQSYLIISYHTISIVSSKSHFFTFTFLASCFLQRSKTENWTHLPSPKGLHHRSVPGPIGIYGFNGWQLTSTNWHPDIHIFGIFV